MENRCGSCTLCCELLDIPWMESPPNHTCVECVVGKGCRIFKTAPKKCLEYDCLYSESDIMQLSLRPDNIHVIFEKITDEIYLGLVSSKYPDAWKTSVVQTYIDVLYSKGISIVISSFSNKSKKMKIAPNHTKQYVENIINIEYNKLRG